MAFPVAAAIAAGAALAGSGAQAYASGKLNKKTLKFNRETRDMQRAWALEDWEKANQYNSPAQQMQRLKEAGLNPHLIYGSGSATSNAAPVRSTDTPSWNPSIPDVGSGIASAGAQGVQAYLDTQRMENQNKLVDAQILKTLTDVDSTKLNMETKKMLQESQATYAKALAEGKLQQNTIDYDKNQREAAKNSADLAEAATRISKMLGEIDLQEMMQRKGNEEIKSIQQMRSKVSEEINQMRKDGTIKDFEIQLNKSGLTKGDPLYARLAKLIADSTGLTPEELKIKVNEVTKDAVNAGKIAKDLPEILYNTIIKGKRK